MEPPGESMNETKCEDDIVLVGKIAIAESPAKKDLYPFPMSAERKKLLISEVYPQAPNPAAAAKNDWEDWLPAYN